MGGEQKIYKIAVVGLGHQSLSDHIPAITKLPNTELSYIVDCDTKKVDEQHSGDAPQMKQYLR